MLRRPGRALSPDMVCRDSERASMQGRQSKPGRALINCPVGNFSEGARMQGRQSKPADQQPTFLNLGMDLNRIKLFYSIYV
jgi:hypothetical protein